MLLFVFKFEYWNFINGDSLHSFYTMQRTAADQILRELQNNPDMWLQVMHILQHTQNLNTKFFALQVSFKLCCFMFDNPNAPQGIQEFRLFP